MISTCTARLHKHRLSGFLILLLSGSLFLASCGAASQSSGGSDSDADYSGTASLSGTIVVSEGDLSQLGETNSEPSSSLSAKLSRVSSKLMSDEENTVLSSGTAVLFEVKDDGSIVETGVMAVTTLKISPMAKNTLSASSKLVKMPMAINSYSKWTALPTFQTVLPQPQRM